LKELKELRKNEKKNNAPDSKGRTSMDMAVRRPSLMAHRYDFPEYCLKSPRCF
jgi:hypothetical protein